MAWNIHSTEKMLKVRFKYFIIILIFLSACSSLDVPTSREEVEVVVYHRGICDECILSEPQIKGTVTYLPSYTKYNKVGKVLTTNPNIKILDSTTSARDSIYGTFKVVEIQKLKNAYQIVGKKIKHKRAYRIILICTSNLEDKRYYAVLSTDTNKRKLEKIKEGKEYNLLLLSYFASDHVWGDRCANILLNDVAILLAPMFGVLNVYTSPNLKGLYYNDSAPNKNKGK